jgi:NADPH:quinone reductase-like Zn-dependent oxidoreductase
LGDTNFGQVTSSQTGTERHIQFQLRLQGIYVGSRSMFERMNRALEQHRIKPVVDRVFPWREIRQAMRYMQSQQHLGKICLEF